MVCQHILHKQQSTGALTCTQCWKSVMCTWYIVYTQSWSTHFCSHCCINYRLHLHCTRYRHWQQTSTNEWIKFRFHHSILVPSLCHSHWCLWGLQTWHTWVVFVSVETAWQLADLTKARVWKDHKSATQFVKVGKQIAQHPWGDNGTHPWLISYTSLPIFAFPILIQSKVIWLFRSSYHTNSVYTV